MATAALTAPLVVTPGAAMATTIGDGLRLEGDASASLVQLHGVSFDGSTLADVGIAESSSVLGTAEGTAMDAGASSAIRNVDLDLAGADAVDGLVTFASDASVFDDSVQFLGVPLGDLGGVGVGEGRIDHDNNNFCMPTYAENAISMIDVESVVVAPDAFPSDAGTAGDGTGVTDADQGAGGGLDDAVDPVNDGVDGITGGADPATSQVDAIVDAVGEALGLPVPGGALLELSPGEGSGIGSQSRVEWVRTDDGVLAGRSTGQVDVVAVGLLGDLLEVDVVSPVRIAATATGTPGGATVDFTAPVLRVAVAGGDVVVLDAATDATSFEIPGVLRLSLGEMTTSEVDPAGTWARGQGHMLRLQVLDPEVVGGLELLDLTMAPVTADVELGVSDCWCPEGMDCGGCGGAAVCEPIPCPDCIPEPECYALRDDCYPAPQPECDPIDPAPECRRCNTAPNGCEPVERPDCETDPDPRFCEQRPPVDCETDPDAECLPVTGGGAMVMATTALAGAWALRRRGGRRATPRGPDGQTAA